MDKDERNRSSAVVARASAWWAEARLGLSFWAGDRDRTRFLMRGWGWGSGAFCGPSLAVGPWLWDVEGGLTNPPQAASVSYRHFEFGLSGGQSGRLAPTQLA